MSLDAICGFTVHEFRLHDEVDPAAAQRDLTALDADPSVPFLTRPGDDRAVAVVRAHHTGDRVPGDDEVRAVIDRIGEEVRSREFRARVALAEPEAGSHFRLAITELGRNDATPDASGTWVAADGPDADSQMLWIGVTSESAEGLFVLVGHGSEALHSENNVAAVPVGASLGVRIYTGTRIEGWRTTEANF